MTDALALLNEKACETFSTLESQDAWGCQDMPRISQEELLEKATEYNLENDLQTRMFIKFLATATNFASAKFKDKLQIVPTIVQEIQNLILEMKKDIKDFHEIAIEFEDLLRLFIRIVLSEKHNLKMILPHLNGSVSTDAAHEHFLRSIKRVLNAFHKKNAKVK
jgi:hypothetical protein